MKVGTKAGGVVVLFLALATTSSGLIAWRAAHSSLMDQQREILLHEAADWTRAVVDRAQRFSSFLEQSSSDRAVSGLALRLAGEAPGEGLETRAALLDYLHRHPAVDALNSLGVFDSAGRVQVILAREGDAASPLEFDAVERLQRQLGRVGVVGRVHTLALDRPDGDAPRMAGGFAVGEDPGGLVTVIAYTDLEPVSDSPVLDWGQFTLIGPAEDVPSSDPLGDPVAWARGGRTGVLETEAASGDPSLVAYAPLDLPGGAWTVLIARPVNEIMEPLKPVIVKTVAAMIIASLLLVIGILWVIDRSFDKPLKALVAAQEKISKGEWDFELDVIRDDEFGQINQAFADAAEEMRRQVHSKEAYLKQLGEVNEQLEARVRERTAELEGALERANSASRARRRFLANMSHQILTPLTAISGFSELIGRGTSLESDQRDHLEQIIQATERLTRTFNEMIDIARTDETPVRRALVNLPELLDRLESVFVSDCQGKGIEWRITSAPKLPQLFWGDPDKLWTILQHLVHNAVRFTDAGAVSVHLGAATDPRIGPVLEIIIQDTGCGIESTQIETVFDPFEQSRLGSESQGGAGLGLTVAQHYAALLGGSIELESDITEGTRVQIRLPMESAMDAGAAEAPGGVSQSNPSFPAGLDQATTLSRLPESVRIKLRRLALSGDESGLRQTLDQVDALVPGARADLERLLGRFDYEAILRALEPAADEAFEPAAPHA